MTITVLPVVVLDPNVTLGVVDDPKEAIAGDCTKEIGVGVGVAAGVGVGVGEGTGVGVGVGVGVGEGTGVGVGVGEGVGEGTGVGVGVGVGVGEGTGVGVGVGAGMVKSHGGEELNPVPFSWPLAVFHAVKLVYDVPPYVTRNDPSVLQ
jgi:hypothetical protein